VLKATAEAQLFVTLFVTVVLRTNLIKDTLTTDDYGGMLVAALMAAPSVELIFITKAVLQLFGICGKESRIYVVENF
jgi:hypothetical protein